MSASNYSLLLSDADNTLFDFYASEKAALKDALSFCGLPFSEETAVLYSRINDSLWKAFERKEITQEELRIERFKRLLSHFCDVAHTAEEVGNCYTDRLGQYAFLLPGAFEFVKRVQKVMPIVLVTNGIASVQRSRLQRSEIAPYITDAIISGEIGCSKPDPKMLFIAMEKMNITDKSSVILLGDSLTADIEAARRAGITSIHLCGLGNSQEKSPADFQAETLADACKILLGG
jgi:YjjG family noncanonical pyrimidine nucleotidase